MKRVVIVVEGQTEQEFVNQCIAPYMFHKYGIPSVSARLIGTPGHKGGAVKYIRLKKDLDILIRENDTIISTFIDFFKLGNDFPETTSCQTHKDISQRITCLEQALADATNSRFFIPYIQKYEFEALLFSSESGFRKYFGQNGCKELEEVNRQFANPEDINSTQPPSYRLVDIVGRHENFAYRKVLYGNILALEIGIEIMMIRCSRFADWIARLGHMAAQR